MFFFFFFFDGKERNRLREGKSWWCRNRPRVDLDYTFKNARKCDGSCPWAWYTTRGRGICAGFGVDWRGSWMKCGLIGFWGRSVAFSFWNVMWWSCGGFATISRKSVWIRFPVGFFPPVSTPLLAGPAALRPFCHWAATQDNESLKLRLNSQQKVKVMRYFKLCYLVKEIFAELIALHLTIQWSVTHLEMLL